MGKKTEKKGIGADNGGDWVPLDYLVFGIGAFTVIAGIGLAIGIAKASWEFATCAKICG